MSMPKSLISDLTNWLCNLNDSRRLIYCDEVSEHAQLDSSFRPLKVKPDLDKLYLLRRAR